jgi:hypothetical protein
MRPWRRALARCVPAQGSAQQQCRARLAAGQLACSGGSLGGTLGHWQRQGGGLRELAGWCEEEGLSGTLTQRLGMCIAKVTVSMEGVISGGASATCELMAVLAGSLHPLFSTLSLPLSCAAFFFGKGIICHVLREFGEGCVVALAELLLGGGAQAPGELVRGVERLMHSSAPLPGAPTPYVAATLDALLAALPSGGLRSAQRHFWSCQQALVAWRQQRCAFRTEWPPPGSSRCPSLGGGAGRMGAPILGPPPLPRAQQRCSSG